MKALADRFKHGSCLAGASEGMMDFLCERGAFLTYVKNYPEIGPHSMGYIVMPNEHSAIIEQALKMETGK